jgi:arabinogalactan oligomer/maltooligosaccharide transport system permease protein
MGWLVWTAFFLIIIFTFQSLTMQIAEKYGHKGLVPGFIGLIPLFGLYYYMKIKPPVRPSNSGKIKSVFNVKNILGTLILYTELVLLAIIVLIPVAYVIGTSLNPFSGIPSSIWPENPSFKNFQFLLEGSALYGAQVRTNEFISWYWNTLQIAFLTMIFSVLFVTGTAYVFARYKFKGKKAGLMTILVLQMFPSFLGLIAIFTLFQTFGLLDQPLALVIIYTAGSIPFNVWLIKGYLQGIPKELDESAKIDGANKLQIFFKIIMPLSVPIISFVAVTQFMAPWLDYILPSFVIETESKWTLAVGIFSFINDQTRINYPAFSAAAILIALPITTLYIVFQRFLIEGITAGANKG